jgi:hypothetical protein
MTHRLGLMRHVLIRVVLLIGTVMVVSRAGMLSVTAVYPDTSLAAGVTLYIRGDNGGLSWDAGKAMVKSAEDEWVWVGSTASNSPVEYKVLLNDSVWCRGANFVTQPSEPSKVFPWFREVGGTIKVVDGIWSPQLNNTRSAAVYFPASYGENTLKQYPLLAMHDGQNLFDPATSAFGVAWMCQVHDASALINKHQGTSPPHTHNPR